MPLTPMTTTRLTPGLRLLWRDERTVQVGADDALRVDADEPWVEPLLSQMGSGFRRSSFDVVAHALGAPREAARALLARVEHLLVTDPPAPRTAVVVRDGVSDARTEYRMRESLEDEGVRLGDAGGTAVSVVLVGGAAASVRFSAHLRDDIAHLPVALDCDRATVGPLVLPGETPCLACRDAHDHDRDPAWPLVHAQLVHRDPGRVRAAIVAAAGAVAARLLAAPASAEGEIVTLSADGSRASRPVSFHEECLCRGTWSRSRPRSATEPAPLVLPIATTTEREFARLA